MQRLQSRIKQTRLQDSKQQMEHHLEETKEQQNRLRQLISNRNGKPQKIRHNYLFLLHPNF
jgi:ferritin-like metal-binding protein YciE